MLVVDASILVVALLDDDEYGQRARARLRGQQLFLPELADLEVASVLRRQVAAGAVTDRRAHSALTDLAELPVPRAPHLPLLAAAWHLRQNLTIYDAVYVSLAASLGAALLTGDRRLARAPGLPCDVEVLAPAR